eukprot:tig00021434_g21337.t1
MDGAGGSAGDDFIGVHWDVLEGEDGGEEAIGERHIAEYSIPSLPRPVRVNQNPAKGIAFAVWNAGTVLGAYLAEMKQRALRETGASAFEGRRVVEVGAGTGITGLACGMLGAHVTLTDRDPVLPLLRANVEANGLQDRVSAAALNWGDAQGAREVRGARPVDYVVMADVLYLEEAFDDLLATLRDLCDGNPRAVVLNCYQERRGEPGFFERAARHFDVEEVRLRPLSDLLRCRTPRPA